MRESENFSPFTASVQWNAEPEKRNSGRTGPTSAEGRSASSKNATKHGACAHTLILPGESEQAWELLLNRWLHEYQPAEDSLELRFRPQNRPSRMAAHPRPPQLQRLFERHHPRPLTLQLGP